MSIPPSRCSPTLETGASNGERASRGKLSPKYFNLSESYFALPTPPDNSDTAPPTKSSPRTTNLPLAIIPSPTSPTGFPRSPPPPLDPARRAVDPARLPLSPSTFPPLSAPSTANSASPRTDVISLFPPLQSNPPRRLADSTRLPLSPSTFSSLSATTSPRKSLSPLASAPGSIRATPSNRFTVFTPTTLVQKLLSPDSSSSKLDSILILDIRTHTAYLHRRLKSSLNICVPSTLLRRPAYGIDRVAEGLSAPERTKLSRWSTATTIIVVDLDSSSLVDGGGITSLLAKFERGGFAGTLGWVKGGFTAISEAAKSTPEGRTLLERGPVEHTPSTTTSTTSKPHLTLPPSRSNRPVLQVRDLPIAAFQQASTATFVHAGLPSATSSLGSSHSSHPPGAIDARTGARMGLGKRRSSGMEGLTLNLIPPMAAEKGLVHLPLTTTPAGETRMASNPFFDNIRQNNEALSLTRSLANLSPIDVPIPTPTSRALLPKFLSSFIDLDSMERASLLARQFYDLEVAERERLEGTMNWHANVQGKEFEGEENDEGFKKFGISAGVELGNANRYKNIFPYDHARVRLQHFPNHATDYINASHIALSGTPKKFIASQGPLQTTFNDFWQMCWQEEVGVIIMLTNINEGGREKCGRYWIEEAGGEWEVRVVGEVKETKEEGGGFFSSPSGSPSPSVNSMAIEPTLETTLRRTLYIRRRSDPPTVPSRKIQHIQFIGWPDFDVPANTSEVLGLVREVEKVQLQYLREIGKREEEAPPVLAHCSAGVGRTGVFILVSSLLDQFRREREIRRRLTSPPPSDPRASTSPPHSPLPASLTLRRGSSMKRAREIDVMDLDPGAAAGGGNRSRSDSNVSNGAAFERGGERANSNEAGRANSSEVGDGLLDRFGHTTIHSPPPPTFSPTFGGVASRHSSSSSATRNSTISTIASTPASSISVPPSHQSSTSLVPTPTTTTNKSPPRLISFASTAALFSSPTSTPTRLEPPTPSVDYTLSGDELVPSTSTTHSNSLSNSTPTEREEMIVEGGLDGEDRRGLREAEVEDVIFVKANEMREMRMSMIANFKQFICVYECCLEGALEEIRLEAALPSDHHYDDHKGME